MIVIYMYVEIDLASICVVVASFFLWDNVLKVLSVCGYFYTNTSIIYLCMWVHI